MTKNICAVLVLLVASVGLPVCKLRAEPNIVLLISDDAGFAEFGFMDEFTGATSPVPTPNLDGLRARGVLFTNAYTSSVCSPSRACIVTGSYSQRIGYEYNINNLTNPNGAHDGLQSSVTTVFERMQGIGYTTGAVGKWHLGALPDIVSGQTIIEEGNRPPRQGVDEFFGILKGSRNYSVGGVGDVGILRSMSLGANGLEIDSIEEANHAGEYVTNTFGQGALDFIDRHQADVDPFFLYVSFTAPHSPIGASPDRNQPGVSSNYGSMVYTMDKEIGRILAKLDDPDGDPETDDSIADNTLVVFINDNGGASGIGTSNLPLRNWKGSPYEGGVRVPMIVAGAGVAADPGSVYAEPVHSIDLLPTFFEVGGGAPLTGIDGVNILPFVNGVADGEPHEFLTMRNATEVGLRMGDWKMVKNGRGSAFQLYDLSADLSETDDVAATNPTVLEEMKRELTRFDAGSDKPRHRGLNNSVDSLNLNDLFRLDPDQIGGGGGGFAADEIIVDGTLNNGGFEENDGPAGAILNFDQVADWANLAGDPLQTCARTNLAPATPGAWNGVGSDNGLRQFALDTGYTIAVGDRFLISYDWRDASGWSDGSDRVRVRLFTTTDDTLTGNRTDFFTGQSNPSSSNSFYQSESLVTSELSGPEVGKRLFVVIDGLDGGGGGTGFFRFDNVSVATAIATPGGGERTVNWSQSNAWIDGDNGQADTLLDLDAFAGAVLEFPHSESFAYSAINDMLRPTGLEFMLNRIVFSGLGEPVALQGDSLLLTENLAGADPSIEVVGESMIENELILFDDLEISGDSGNLTLTGGMRDFEFPRGLRKSGDAGLTMVGEHSFSGDAVIDDGVYTLDGSLSGVRSVKVNTAASISANGTIGGNLEVVGTFRLPFGGGSSTHVRVGGHVTLHDAVLDITGVPIEPEVGFISYGSVTGTFATVIGMPAGYTLDYSHEGEGGEPQIALVSHTPYMLWAEVTSGLAGADAAFDTDPNDDGVSNGLAFFLGADNASADASDLLPSATIMDGDLEFTFGRSSANQLSFEVQYSADLQGWNLAVDGINGVTVTEVGSTTTVAFPLNLADGNDFYLRLSVSQP